MNRAVFTYWAKGFWPATRRLLVLMGLFTASRIIFYAANRNLYYDIELKDILRACLVGLRFDLSAVCSIQLPYLILYHAPFPYGSINMRHRLLRWLWVVATAPALALNLIDSEYFKFTGKRTTWDVVNISSDIKDQFFSLVVGYWYVPLYWLALLGVLYLTYGKDDDRTSEGAIGKLGRLFIVAGLAVLAIRGSFQVRPLLPGHAFSLQPAKLGHLALNTPFVFIKSIQNQSTLPLNIMPPEAVSKWWCPPGDTTRVVGYPGTNIVLIILESCAREYMGYGNPYPGFTPFLDSLCAEGLFFDNHYANGRTSQDAVPALLASIPRLGAEPYIASAQVTNEIQGLGHLLRKAGYHTAFFHGGRNGTMGFDYFAALAGIEHYYGLNEYPIEAHDDGHWGIFDGPFFQFFGKKITEMPQPFGAVIFTLSAHHPYRVPDSLQNKLPQGDLPIHKPIAYTDRALKDFFRYAQHQSWFNNTLFIITADHTQMNSVAAYNTELGQFAVPLLFYHPLKKLPKANRKKIVQHIDVLPSVAEYLQIPLDKQILLAQSVWESGPGEAIFNTNGFYVLHSDSVYVRWSESGAAEIYRWPKYEPVNPAYADGHKALQKLKAGVQYFNIALLENKWYGWCLNKKDP